VQTTQTFVRSKLGRRRSALTWRANASPLSNKAPAIISQIVPNKDVLGIQGQSWPYSIILSITTTWGVHSPTRSCPSYTRRVQTIFERGRPKFSIQTPCSLDDKDSEHLIPWVSSSQHIGKVPSIPEKPSCCRRCSQCSSLARCWADMQMRWVWLSCGAPNIRVSGWIAPCKLVMT
jgi:hypothetical protein